MGAPRGEPGAARFNNRQVQVTLTRGFLIGQTELTRAAWMETGWGKPKRNVVVGVGDCLDAECPINNVNFFDAIQYANWLSEREGLEPCYELSGCNGEVGLDLECSGVMLTTESAYSCKGFRLPMEAEWEYAARASTITAFYGGESVSTQNHNSCISEPGLEPFGWYCFNSDQLPHPAAQKQPNAWGLYDMHGNMMEWVNDLHDGLGYGQGPLIDPMGTLTPGRNLNPTPEKLYARVLRGGGYMLASAVCTSALRYGAESKRSSSSAGFRLVRTL